MYPENPEGTQIIVGSMNMGYISDTARNRTHNLFRPKREPIPLGHNDGLFISHPAQLSRVLEIASNINFFSMALHDYLLLTSNHRVIRLVRSSAAPTIGSFLQ